jgi:O-antigen/teichoic acid export membrane protein
LTKPLRLQDSSFSLFRFNLLSNGIRIVTSVIVARTLGPELMGLWILLSMFPTWADGLGRLKVDVAAIYVLGRGRGTFAEVSGAIHVIALVAGLGVSLVLLAAEPWVLPWLSSRGATSVWVYRFVLVSIPVTFVATNYAYLLLQREDIDGYNRCTFLRSVFPSLAAVALLSVTPLRIGALVFGLVSGGCIGIVYGAYRLRDLPHPRLPDERSLWFELTSYGWRLYAVGVVENLNLYLSSLLLGIYLRPAELTYFRIGQDRLQLIDQIPSAMGTVLYPRIANTPGGRSQHVLVGRSCRVLTALLCGCGLLGAVLAPALVWILYGAAYFPVARAIWLLLPGVVALGIAQPLGQYFAGSGRADLVWKLALLPLVIQVAALVPMMRLFGFEGAALVVAVSFVAHAVVRMLVWKRLTGESIRMLVFVTRDDFNLLAGFASEVLPWPWRTKSPAVGPPSAQTGPADS